VVTCGFHLIGRYVGVNHGRVMWDVSIFDISVNFPWRNTASECSNTVTTLVFNLNVSQFCDIKCVASSFTFLTATCLWCNLCAVSSLGALFCVVYIFSKKR